MRMLGQTEEASVLLARNRNFRLVFSASAISNLGDGVSALALPWLATLLTRDAFLIAMVVMAGRLPWFLLSLPAGVWTDRADRRLLMVRADLVRFGLTLLVVGLALTAPSAPLAESEGTAQILALSVLAFLLGCAEVLRDNAAQTILPSIVAKPDLEAANGQIWSVERVMGEFIGPPLAGVLIALGVAVPFGFDAASFALAAVLIWLLVLPPRELPQPAPFKAAFLEGIGWMRANPIILRLAVMLGAVNASYMAGATIMVLYAQEVLGLDALGTGFLMTAGAVGSVLGGLLGPRICKRLGLRASMIFGLVAFCTHYILFAITGQPAIAGLALATGGFGAMVWNVATVSFRQRIIPDAVLGRVNSIYRFFGWGAMPLGALAGGAIVSLTEQDLGRDLALRLPFVAATIGTVIVLAYALARLRTP
jgi:MFS family permease